MNNCPSRFTLVQLHSGDLPQTFATSLRAHVAGCNCCTALLCDIEANCAVYESRVNHHNARLSDRINSESALLKPRPLHVPIIAIGVAMAAAAIISLAFLFHSESDTQTNQTFLHTTEAPTFKGTFSAQIHARRADEIFEVTQGMTLQAGDQLRFTITAATPGYVSVISITEDGHISPYYPYESTETEPTPLKIDAAGQTVLPGSIMLDASTGTYYLMILFSDEPFDRALVHERLKDLAFRTGGAHQLDNIRIQVVKTVKEHE